MDWARELQFLGQSGLAYTKNEFDAGRYERIREIAAEMMAEGTDTPVEKVRGLFCDETGYQTPKLDTRAAIIEQGRVLLVREKTGLWTLPGGWVDVEQSVASNALKEVFEESGVVAEIVKPVALCDLRLTGYLYRVCKVFVLARRLSGEFCENPETTQADWFSLDALPELSVYKSSREQIEMCFAAAADENWRMVLE